MKCYFGTGMETPLTKTVTFKRLVNRKFAFSNFLQHLQALMLSFLFDNEQSAVIVEQAENLFNRE